MNTIAVISFYYPPYKGVAVNRILRFNKALTSAGKEILTIAPQDNMIRNKSGCVELPVLVKKLCALPSKAEVRSQKPQRTLPVVFWKLFKFLSIPDRQIYWIPYVIQKILGIVKTKKIDCIITTSPPVSSHICGLLLKKLLCVPWFAEFRDTWTYDPLEPFLVRSKWRLHMEAFLENNVVKRCDRIIVNSDIALKFFHKRYLKNHEDKTVLIYTGYDTADYNKSMEKKKSKKFRIVHTGSFNLSRYSIKIKNVLKGLCYAIKNNKRFSQEVEILLVGALSNEEKGMIKQFSLENIIKVIPPVTHQEAIQFQLSADLLLAVNHASPILTADIPGKIFEYIGAAKPILAITTAGALENIVKKTDGFVVSPTNIQSIGEMFIKLHKFHNDQQLSKHVDFQFRQKMTTEKNVRTLLDVMNDLSRKCGEYESC